MWKCCFQHVIKFWKLSRATGLEKVSVYSNPKEGNSKECSNCHTTVLISHTSRVMLKIIQARLQQYVNWELPVVQVGFAKAEEPFKKNQIANICWIMEKTREFQENICFASLTTLKPLTVWITTNCGKFLKRWVPDHLTCLLRILCGINKQQLELDMEQQTGSKLGRSTARLCLVTLPT